MISPFSETQKISFSTTIGEANLLLYLAMTLHSSNFSIWVLLCIIIISYRSRKYHIICGGGDIRFIPLRCPDQECNIFLLGGFEYVKLDLIIFWLFDWDIWELFGWRWGNLPLYLEVDLIRGAVLGWEVLFWGFIKVGWTVWLVLWLLTKEFTTLLGLWFWTFIIGLGWICSFWYLIWGLLKEGGSWLLGLK